MTKNIHPDMVDQKHKHLAFLYLIKEEFGEAIRFAGALQNKEWFIDGGEHALPEVRALDIALVITYSRPFKKNYGFGKVTAILERAMKDFESMHHELHNRIIIMRDREYAHADAEVNDVKVYFGDIFTFSKFVTREPLQRFEVLLLIDMCQMLIVSIDEQIKEHRALLTNK